MYLEINWQRWQFQKMSFDFYLSLSRLWYLDTMLENKRLELTLRNPCRHSFSQRDCCWLTRSSSDWKELSVFFSFWSGSYLSGTVIYYMQPISLCVTAQASFSSWKLPLMIPRMLTKAYLLTFTLMLYWLHQSSIAVRLESSSSWIEASTLKSSANPKQCVDSIPFVKSFIKIKKKRGPNIDPCGTPLETTPFLDLLSRIWTYCSVLAIKDCRSSGSSEPLPLLLL